MSKDPSTRSRRLPRGTHALPPEEVARIHRGWLRQGMIDAVYERGYLDTRITDVTGHANVARNAFYAQFSSKEELLLVAREAIVEQISAELHDAISASDPRDPAAVLEAVISTLLRRAAAHPKEAGVLLVDVLAIGAHGPAHRRQTRAQLQELIAPSLAGVFAPVAQTAIVGGLLQVITTHLLHRSTGELRGLVPDMVAWALTYRDVELPAIGDDAAADDPVPGAAHPARRLPSETAPLPRGRHRLPRSVMAHNHRERILDAVIAITAAGGYAALTVPSIASTAGISHQTFYEHFVDKHAAFLAALGAAQSRGLAAARTAYAGQPHWPDAVAAAVRSWTALLAADPRSAKFCFNDAFSSGLEAQQHIDAAQLHFAELLEHGYDEPSAGAVPAVAASAIVGGLWTLIEDQVVAGATAALPQLAPSLTAIALTPFVGGDAARRAADTAA